MTTRTEISPLSSAVQTTPDQSRGGDQRSNPHNTFLGRPSRRGRGGNRGGSGNVNTARDRSLFYGRERGRGGGLNRGGPGTGTTSTRSRGRGDAAITTRTVAGTARSFGGRLTREEPEGTNNVRGDAFLDRGDQASLQHNAPEFVPGVQVYPPSSSRPFRTLTSASSAGFQKSVPTPAHTRSATKTKSTAHDIATCTHEDIANGLYECPICTSELGRKSKVWSYQDSSKDMKTGRSIRDSGGVLGVICLTTFCHRHIHAGARRRRIHDLYLGCHPIRADRLVPRRGKDVHIPVILCVMRVLALLVWLWGQHSFVSAGAMSRGRNVLIRITRTGGVVRSRAGSYCHVFNTSAVDRVMKGFAELARSLSMPDVIAESRRHGWYAVIARRRKRVVSPMVRTYLEKKWRNDLHHCHIFLATNLGNLVKIPYQIAKNHVENPSHVNTIAPFSATPARARHATMNCGRHACGERCCPGERKAIERQATKRKLRSISRNIYVPEFVAGCLNAPYIRARNCATREAVVHVQRQYSMKYPATAADQCFTHHYHVALVLLPAITIARDQSHADILRRRTTIPVVALSAARRSSAAPTHARNPAIDRGSARMSSSPVASHAEKTPCQSLVTTTCPCGRLKQEKRCNASRDNKNRIQQHHQSPVPLKCDDECARLQRNRSLASALNISIDPHTTTTNVITATADGQSPTSTPANFPYSSETLDLYLTLSATSTLTTLQSYETILHSLATSQTQRTARFPPARSQVRAFIHSLATDWGFKSESCDPEPHRHVAVFKSTHWMPPRGFGAEVDGAVVGIGIGGVSVGECAKMRERERARERESRRIAAAAAERNKMESRAVYAGGDGDGSTHVASAGGDGWAQVASRKRPVVDTGLAESEFGFGDVGGTSAGGGMSGTLVLRSGVGVGGRGKAATPSSGVGGGWRKFPAGFVEDVVDDWEEAVEREEREMEKGGQVADGDGASEGKDENETGNAKGIPDKHMMSNEEGKAIQSGE
ncbi:hypothetical protein ACO22_05551 [Paracoccidioides brasiliensis]|uniref:R3H domain-containing protein n=1 Tax=Paracoccidioides brasiliensis TaxID=121759 RepID=A0A1D2J9Z7_PARBR|nr:hypothetical protein ACO22_05551 [Paracoccidioides brasiliensis]